MSSDKDDAMDEENEQRNILEISENKENEAIRESNKDWISIVNERRTNSNKLNKEIISVKTGKMHVVAEDANQGMSKIDASTEATGMTDFEKETLQFVQNRKTVYEDSTEEPAMIYYNKDDKLLSFELDLTT